MAWGETFDVNTPLGAADPKEGDDRLRELKAALQERIAQDHYFPLTGTEVSDTAAGEHKKVTLRQASKPSHVADKGFIYTKDVGGATELFYLDEAGNEKQLTSGGALKCVAGDFGADSIDADDIRLANDSYLTARNAAGDSDVNIIKVNASNLVEILVGAVLSADTAPASDAAIANKKYVDDQIVADYDSGWFAVVGSSGDTKAHSLAVRPSRVKIMYRKATDSTVYFEIGNDEVSNHGTAVGYDTTNIYIRPGAYVNPLASAVIDAVDGANSTTGQYRILAWK